ncbi:MAG: hypothetical protein K8S98_03830 [Planctomycetes bacterium]|nr:hypothetical protein [Planctomycetota bacterium]
MTFLHARIRSFALFLVVVCAAPVASAQRPSPNQEAIQAAVAWMRASQDATTGRYGSGVEDTALALRAFNECPTHYLTSDGPFVTKALEFLATRQREDGAICDAGASDAAAREQTELAAQAIFELGGQAYAARLARALRYLGSLEVEIEDETPADETAAQTNARAAALLARQTQPGRWSGEQGELEATARAVIELSFIEQRLQRTNAPTAAKAPVLPPFSPADRDAAAAAMKRGAEFLAASAAPDGTWGGPGVPDAGITAMVVGALQLVPAPRSPTVQSAIDKGLAWLLTLQHDDGAFHQGMLPCYVTSATVLALERARKDEYKPRIAKAREFLVRVQLDGGEGYSESDPYYGGIGYGAGDRPDLSNLQMALEALTATGSGADAETYAKAVKFLARCQNRSETNDIHVADGKVVIVSGDDGGSAYRPADSKAGFVALSDGRKVPRSYGSMTYALLKCFVFAGVPKDDPRMQAAWKWCQANYTLDVNPGFQYSVDPTAAYQGLFYYFYTMARALDAYGVDQIVDAAGKPHAWRAELAGRLIAMQSKIDGSWVNKSSQRWYEGNPLLATAYALSTLHETLAAPASK